MAETPDNLVDVTVGTVVAAPDGCVGAWVRVARLAVVGATITWVSVTIGPAVPAAAGGVGTAVGTWGKSVGSRGGVSPRRKPGNNVRSNKPACAHCSYTVNCAAIPSVSSRAAGASGVTLSTQARVS